MKIINLAIDLETLSCNPNAAIISIAARPFDKKDPTAYSSEDVFEANINATSCALSGMHFDENTVEFWANQSDEAKAAILNGESVSIREALDTFVSYCDYLKTHFNAEIKVWAQGTDFDLPKIEWAIANVLGLSEMPWKYNAKADARTYILESIEDTFGTLPDPYAVLPVFEGYVPHSAMSDVNRMIFNIQHVANGEYIGSEERITEE